MEHNSFVDQKNKPGHKKVTIMISIDTGKCKANNNSNSLIKLDLTSAGLNSIPWCLEIEDASFNFGPSVHMIKLIFQDSCIIII